MRKRTSKAVLTVSVAAAAAVGLIAAGTALANPRPEPDVYTSVEAPTWIASDAADGVEFTPVVGNKSDSAVTDVTLTITLASADSGVDPQLAVASSDDRCEVAGATVTCEFTELAAGTTEKPKLRLSVLDADSWKTHPVTEFDAKLSGGATDSVWDSTYTYSAGNDPVERIDFDLPPSIPYDQGEPVGGTHVRFVLSSDDGQSLKNATFKVTVEGLGDEPTLEVDSRRYRDCDETVDHEMTCSIDHIYGNDYTSFDVLVYAVNTDQKQNDSVLKTELTWTDDAGDTHTFAQRHEYAIISPAEG